MGSISIWARRHGLKKPIDAEHWYFVDETGDPVFYDKRGNLIVGQDGCSPIFGLGFIDTNNPAAIRSALNDLHLQVATDEYLRHIPSISRTNRAFHAKDDTPEVRYLVYRRLAELDFKAQFVIARKSEQLFRNTFGSRESDFYDALVSKLFESVLHRHRTNRIYFSRRGTRVRQNRLEQAIKNGIGKFEAKWNAKVNTEIRVESHTGVGEPCLQVADYMNWAVYRAFVKREMRYYRFVEPKVSLLVDLYDTANYPNNWYSRNNPFDIDKASPL